MKSRRIVFYSHDTFGLGHIRRTQKLANQIAAPDRSILIICASPKASAFPSAKGIEHLNLPGFAKQENGEYLPRNLNMPVDEFTRLRADLLLTAVRQMKPDVFVVDKEPLGVKKELLPALEYLRAEVPHCRIVCGFRDILDESSQVAREWQKRGTVEALRQFYDHILIYGEKKYFDFAQNYHLPPDLAAKLHYVGYVNDETVCILPNGNADMESAPLTFTMGGGADAEAALSLSLKWIEETPQLPPIVLLTGPFAPPALQEKARRLAAEKTGVQVLDFVASPLEVFRRSRALVSMGGYNAMTEIAALGKPLLVLPRTQPRLEQKIRAEIFASQGLCRFLIPAESTTTDLQREIEYLWNRTENPRLEARGLSAFRQLFIDGVLA